jgi:hypothetical protein
MYIMTYFEEKVSDVFPSDGSYKVLSTKPFFGPRHKIKLNFEQFSK